MLNKQVRSSEKERTSSCSFADRIAKLSIDTFKDLCQNIDHEVSFQ